MISVLLLSILGWFISLASDSLALIISFSIFIAAQMICLSIEDISKKL